MKDPLKHKESEVFDGGGHGTFDTGGGDWGKSLGYHIIDTGIEYDIEKGDKKMEKKKVEKLKGEIIDEVFSDYTKRKEKERVKPKEAGKKKGPGVPDGTGPMSDSPKCQMNENEFAEEVKKEEKEEVKEDAKEKPTETPKEIVNFSALLNQIFEKKNVGEPQYKELGIPGWYVEITVPTINRYDLEKIMKNRYFGYISLPSPAKDDTYRIFVEDK